MKRFLIQSLIFFIIIMASLAAGVKFIPIDRYNYLRAYTYKMEMLDTVSSPRIVFVGGSNLAFGLMSDVIADSLGVNVVNSALHAGIGLRYTMYDVGKRLRDNDIVVIAPEYGNFTSSFDGNDEALPVIWILSEDCKIKHLNYNQITNIISGVPRTIYGSIRRRNAIDSIYSCISFNKYGDHITHFDKECKKIGNPGSIGKINKKNCEIIAKTITDWRQRGIKVLLVPPVTTEANYSANESEINEIYSEMKSLGAPFYVNARAHVLPDTCAFDTPYHMRRFGAQQFTSSLINEIIFSSTHRAP